MEYLADTRLSFVSEIDTLNILQDFDASNFLVRCWEFDAMDELIYCV